VATYSTPGVYYEEVVPRGERITAVRTDVAAFVGLAPRGPLHVPVRVDSWAQFAAIFGGFVPYAYLSYSVKAFFENGGRTCFVVRVAGATATAASAPLIGPATDPALRVRARSAGRWGDRLTAEAVRTSPAGTRARGVQPTGRGSSVVDDVAGFDRGSLVRVFQAGTIPVEIYRVVTDVDAVAGSLTWDEPLDVTVAVDRPISFETVELALTVRLDGHVRERLGRLALSSRHARFAPVAVDADATLVALDAAWTGADPPLPGRLLGLAAAALARGPIALSGGVDGLATLTPEDFSGAGDEEPPRGLAALVDVEAVSLVAVPDIFVAPRPARPTAPPAQPPPDPCLGEEPAATPLPADETDEQVPPFSLEQVFAVQQALVDHCELVHDRVALLDPPAGFARSELESDRILGWRARFDSSFAALAYPWVTVVDPLRLDGRVVREVPPSGHVAGVYARTDLARGVQRAPANVELEWAQDVTVHVAPELHGVLNPAGINAIRVFPGRGIRLYGARTVSSDADWRYVNVRRLLLMIERSVGRAVRWAVFEPNDAVLRSLVALSISSFLEELWRRGALMGAKPDEAFYVRCDETNNAPAGLDAGELVAEVGVAPVKPAEFVVFRIARTRDELEVIE
jgi:hypothetical protein